MKKRERERQRRVKKEGVSQREEGVDIRGLIREREREWWRNRE